MAVETGAFTATTTAQDMGLTAKSTPTGGTKVQLRNEGANAVAIGGDNTVVAGDYSLAASGGTAEFEIYSGDKVWIIAAATTSSVRFLVTYPS